MFLLLTDTLAFAQVSDPLAAIGPYHFGMSEAEVIRADPNAQLSREGIGGDIVFVSGPGRIEIGGISFSPGFDILGGGLKRVELRARGVVLDADQCANIWRSVISAMEVRAGAFVGAAAEDEYGVLKSNEATARGSQLRFYSFPDSDVIAGYANARNQQFVEAWGVFSTDLGSATPRKLCNLQLSFDATPYPTHATLTPPTSAQLEAAPLIEAPVWTSQPLSMDYARTYPEVAMERRIFGTIELDCLVIEEGALNCAVTHEDPNNLFLGQASLNISRYFRIAPSINGVPTLGRRVHLVNPMGAPGGPNSHYTPQDEVKAQLDALRALAAHGPTDAELARAILIANPVWTVRPSAEDFERYYPVDAIAQGIGGHALLDCLVKPDGSLRCKVSEETPESAEFGLAALGIAQAYRMASAINERPTAGERVRVSLTFSTN